MKSEREIQRAHDLLTGIVLGEVPVKFSPDVQEGVIAALDALCWVLGHEHNQSFAGNLAEIEKALEQAGWVLAEVQTEPLSEDKPA